jgi:hypothetical protein
MLSGDKFPSVRRAEAGGSSCRADRARRPGLSLTLTIALFLVAVAAFGLARSSHGAPEPPASLDRLSVPPVLMPPPPPRPPVSDHRIQIGEAADSRIFGAISAPSRGFAEVRRDEVASVIEGRRSLISTDRKVWVL